MKRIAITITAFLFFAATAHAQRDWMNDGADAQRSGWIRSDGKINKDSMSKPGFQFLWKTKVKNPPRQLNSLQPPSTLDRLIGYRGFRMLGFFAGSNNNLITIDTDLGRLEWEKTLKVGAAPGAGTLQCPGGMTTGVVRPVLAAIPPSPTGGGGGRQNPAKSAVGEPGQGAVTLANVRPQNFNMGAMMPQQTRVNPANPPGGQLGAGPFLVYALASDGKLHALHLSNGADFEPPVNFIPAGANANGLIVVDQTAYVVTENNCNGAANGVWAIDLISKEVKSFKANIVGSAGVAFDGNGTIYVTTGSGGDNSNSLVALDQKTLAVKGSFSTGSLEFASSPVVFAHKGKAMITATTKDGRIHIFDSTNLNAPLVSSMAITNFTPGALASWQDVNGTRWILVPTSNAVVAWKVVEQGGNVSLQQSWASRELVAPLPPTIINGVAFVTSGGEFRTNDSKVTAAQRAARSKPAVIYALDATTGKELWNSGTAITSFARGSAIAGAMGQIYLTTYDGTIYTFGFPMEH